MSIKATATAKPKPFPPRLEASAKSKGASLPTRRNDEGVGNAVKGRDERQQRAPLTAFPTRRPRLPFFSLTRAVVVIDRKTEINIFYQTEKPPIYSITKLPIYQIPHFSHFALGSSSLISTPLVWRRIICSASSMIREAAAPVLTPRA